MSYAQAWNDKWTGPRVDGPTLIIVDGLHEEHAEQFDGMDTDGDDYMIDSTSVLDDIRSERVGWGSRAYIGLGDEQTSDMFSAMELDVGAVSADPFLRKGRR